MLRSLSRIVAFTGLLALPSVAQAVPVLQVYVEGATYDDAEESWILTGSGSFRLWIIGNVAGAGGKGPISGVRISAAYDAAATGVSIALTPTTAGGAGGYGGVADPSTASEALHLQTRTDGSAPLLGDGSPLPSHGIFGAGTHWQEFGLGDFTLTDSHIGDFISSFPTSLDDLAGQINVYDVAVSGTNPDGSGVVVHFDAYNHVGAENHVRFSFAPFSHDGDGSGDAPEPAPLALLGAGALGIALRSRGQLGRG